MLPSVIDFRRGTNVGQEWNTSRHFGSRNTPTADGKSSSYTNTLRSHSCLYIGFFFSIFL